jgi:fucose permease
MSRRTLTLILGFIAFIALGLPDALLGLAWPFMRTAIEQPLEASGLIVLSGTLGAALSGFFSSWLGRHLGIGRLLALSCALTGIALIGYALAPSLGVILICAIIIGIAAGATDATVNGYVAKNFGDRLMQWLHASFGVGITIGPVVMTLILAQQLSWQLGYTIHAGLQLVLALLFFVTAGIWLAGKKSSATPQQDKHAADHHDTTMLHSLTDIRIWLAMASFFFYCGLEYSVGLWTFSLLTENRGVSTAQAGLWVSIYWGMFTVGRMVMGTIAHKLAPTRMIVFGLISAALGTALFAISTDVYINLLAIIIIGFAYAPLYPAMVSTTLRRVGIEHFNNAMGLQVTGASLGIALLPGLIGWIAAHTSLTLYPWLLLAITAILVLVSWTAHRLPVSRDSSKAG